MTLFEIRAGRGLGIALIVLAVGVTGCARHTPQDNQEKTEAATAGAAMQQNGIMSQSDYTRIRELGHSTSQIHAMSDADLTWTLGFLSKATNSTARARAFNTLSAIRPMSAAQKAKIRPAITPYLSNGDELDQAGAQRVQKALQADS